MSNAPARTRPRPLPGGTTRLRRLWAGLPRGQSLPDEVWAQRHRRILLLLWLHVPGLFAFAVLGGESALHGLAEAGLVAAFATTATGLQAHRRSSTIVAALGLLTCSAVIVHLSGGVIEMHFHYFVMIGVVTLYQDWWPFLGAIAYVVLQHGVAGMLSPESVYNHQEAVDAPWLWAGIHGAFILAMSTAGIASWRLNESLMEATLERQAQLAEAQRMAQVGSWEIDLVTGTRNWSEQLYRLFDVDPAVFRPTEENLAALVHPDDRPLVQAAFAATAAGRSPDPFDMRVPLADGTVRWLHCRGQAMTSPNGLVTALSGTALDITEAKRAEAEQQETLALLAATLDSTADGILVVDRSGRIRSFNQKFVEMWHLSPEILASGDDHVALAAVLAQLVDAHAFVARIEALYADHEAESRDTLQFLDGRTFERYSKPQRVKGVTVGRVWSFRDVTDHKRLENELAHQAFHDSLTGLANRSLFRDRLEHGLARRDRHGGDLAVLFIDLDHFKTVNDSLGHTAGDELLVAVADRLRSCLRDSDTAARVGGDEFAVLLEDLDGPGAATALADRLLAAFRQPFAIAGRHMVVGASIGIALGTPGTDRGQLLRNADIAMYTAKRRGRGGFQLFAPEMHAAALDRLETETDLRRTLERGELTLEFQPVVALDSRRIAGVEALVRWRHPERGLLGPDAFVALAEETGLIFELGRQVLIEACVQARHWQIRHPEHASLDVFVNLSPRQLQADGIIDEVRAALAWSGLPASNLVLEITEGTMMQDSEATITRLDALKELGVRLAVDDFGTGYSSLSYLQRFPVDILKVDRSFVTGVATEGRKSQLVRAILSLAGTLGLSCVAEGVETAAQAVRLTELGCGLAQGYHLARPLGPDEIDRLLVAGLPDARPANHVTAGDAAPAATPAPARS